MKALTEDGRQTRRVQDQLLRCKALCIIYSHDLVFLKVQFTEQVFQCICSDETKTVTLLCNCSSKQVPIALELRLRVSCYHLYFIVELLKHDQTEDKVKLDPSETHLLFISLYIISVNDCHVIFIPKGLSLRVAPLGLPMI